MKKWANLVDDGRLIKVKDQFFLFIRYVETLGTKTLTTKGHLLHEVLRKWIDIRGNTFAKTFTLVFKQKFIICLMIKRIDNLNQQNQT